VPTTPKILAFAGSLRRESYNKKLAKAALAGAKAAGADVTFLDLADIPMPIFDEDLEARDGLHPSARKFKDLLLAHHGFIITSPEYNSSVSAALKNALDWASRPVPGEKPLECFVGKAAAIMAASPGALGGLRGLVTLRSILSNIQVLVLPDQHAVVHADKVFDAHGRMTDDKQRERVEAIARKLADTVRCLNG